MSSVQIKDKTENTAPAGDEWLFVQDPADPFTVKKMSVKTMGDYIAYRPGSIIEYLTSVCDGSEVVGVSGTYTWPEVTTQQELTETHEDITGSSIAYTPPEGANKIVYRFSFKGMSCNNRPVGHFMLLLDGVEIESARTTIDASYREQQNLIEWVFDSWEGSKTIKLQGRNLRPTYECILHNIRNWNDEMVNSFHPPILTIIAIA